MSLCSYGSEPVGTDATYQITHDDVIETFGEDSLVAKAYAVFGVIFPLLDVPTFCSVEPAQPVSINEQDVLLSFISPLIFRPALLDKIRQNVEYKKWFDLCKCKKYSNPNPQGPPQLPPDPRGFPPCPPGCSRPIIGYMWYYAGSQAPTDPVAFSAYYHGLLLDAPFTYGSSGSEDCGGVTTISGGPITNLPILLYDITNIYEQYSGSLPPPANTSCPYVHYDFIGESGITLTDGTYVYNTWVKTSQGYTNPKHIILVAVNDSVDGNPPTIGASYDTGAGEFPGIPDCVCPDPAPIGPDPIPPDTPLPPDTFNFCQEFPELCPDCPQCEDMKVKQDSIQVPQFAEDGTYTIGTVSTPVLEDIDGNRTTAFQAQLAQGQIDILNYVDKKFTFATSGIVKDENCGDTAIAGTNLAQFATNVNLQLQAIQSKLCNLYKFDSASIVKDELCGTTVVNAGNLPDAIRNVMLQLQAVQTKVCSLDPNAIPTNTFSISTIVKDELCNDTVVTATDLPTAILNTNLQLQAVQTLLCSHFNFDTSAYIRDSDCVETSVYGPNLHTAVRNIMLQLQAVQQQICSVYKFDSSTIVKDELCGNTVATATNLPAAIRNMMLQSQAIATQVCKAPSDSQKKLIIFVGDQFESTGNVSQSPYFGMQYEDGSTVDSDVYNRLHSIYMNFLNAIQTYAQYVGKDTELTDQQKLGLTDKTRALLARVMQSINGMLFTEQSAGVALVEICATGLTLIRNANKSEDDPLTTLTVPDLFDTSGNLISLSGSGSLPTLDNPDSLPGLTDAQTELQTIWTRFVGTVRDYIDAQPNP